MRNFNSPAVMVPYNICGEDPPRRMWHVVVEYTVHLVTARSGEEEVLFVMVHYVPLLLALGLLSLEAGSFVFPLAPPRSPLTCTGGAAAPDSRRVCQPVSHRTAGRGVVLQSTTDKVFISERIADLAHEQHAVILVQHASVSSFLLASAEAAAAPRHRFQRLTPTTSHTCFIRVKFRLQR